MTKVARHAAAEQMFAMINTKKPRRAAQPKEKRAPSPWLLPVWLLI
jgi:hypothetical protein